MQGKEQHLNSLDKLPAQSEIFFSLQKIMFSFHVTLLTKPRITAHIRDRILAVFPSISLPCIYVVETTYIFIYIYTFYIYTLLSSSRHCSVMYIYIKNDTTQNIGMCLGVCISLDTSPFCFH